MINKDYPSALHWEWHDGLDEWELYNGQVLTHFSVGWAIREGKKYWIASFGVFGPDCPIEEVRVRYETLEAAKLACEDFFELENGEFPIILSRQQ